MSDPLPVAKRPSLRRRLLLFLLVPMGVLLLLDAVVTYTVALDYSNRVHDNDLSDDVRTLAQMFRSGEVSDNLSEEARFLIEYDPDGHNYYTVKSSKHGELGGNGDFSQPPAPPPDGTPLLFYSNYEGKTLRAATLSLHSPRDPSEILTVTIGETLRDRHKRARQILFLTIPLQTLLIAGSLSLVWLGVSRGLRILQPLTRRLAAREHELGPITDGDVPQEILPLTQTIDALFARLREVLSLQERFMADAAHQLRTPLAGLQLHAERALGSTDPDTSRDALEHIHRLTQRTARTSTQLLALTRAQNPWFEPAQLGLVDLDQLVPGVLALHVQEAIRANVDLGYHGTGEPAQIEGDAGALQELLENLIDNALRYAGRKAKITATVIRLPDEGVVLQVEDNGPGVPQELLARLGERFFRAPGASEGGTGLGLAIVQQIVQQHRGAVAYSGVPGGGLRVTIQFPAPAKSS
jgi:two-component system sensor histidine kinase TctE